VRIIGAVAKEYCTPVPMVLKMSWCLFMALVRDLCERIKAENRIRQKHEMKHRTMEHMKKNSSPV